MSNQATASSGSAKAHTPTSTFLVFATDDGMSLRRVGKVQAISADQAVRKHIADQGEISAETTFSYLAAISENYFKLRKPMPKVTTTVALEDVDWDSFKTPVPPQAPDGNEPPTA